MEHYAGIDVSLELSSVCVVDAKGKIVREAKVASEPEALVGFFEALGFAVKRGRSGSRAAVAMAACEAETSRIRDGSAGNAACEGSVIGDDGQDGPQGCTRYCPADPDGVVPPGARQIDKIAGGARAAGCAQTASWAAYRR